MDKEVSKKQAQITAQWKAFSQTEAYKDWMLSMEQYMQMIQDNVDNMVEPRPAAGGKSEFVPIDSEKANILNQRKVGARYAVQYARLRVES